MVKTVPIVGGMIGSRRGREMMGRVCVCKARWMVKWDQLSVV